MTTSEQADLGERAGKAADGLEVRLAYIEALSDHGVRRALAYIAGHDPAAFDAAMAGTNHGTTDMTSCEDCGKPARRLQDGWYHRTLSESMACPGGQPPGQVRVVDPHQEDRAAARMNRT